MQINRVIKDKRFLNSFPDHWKNSNFHNASFIKWLMILGVILLSTLAGRMASTSLLKMVILLAGGVTFGSDRAAQHAAGADTGAADLGDEWGGDRDRADNPLAGWTDHDRFFNRDLGV